MKQNELKGHCSKKIYLLVQIQIALKSENKKGTNTNHQMSSCNLVKAYVNGLFHRVIITANSTEWFQHDMCQESF